MASLCHIRVNIWCPVQPSLFVIVHIKEHNFKEWWLVIGLLSPSVIIITKQGGWSGSNCHITGRMILLYHQCSIDDLMSRPVFGFNNDPLRLDQNGHTLQIILSKIFTIKKLFVFWFKCHWILFEMFQMALSYHELMLTLHDEQATRFYLSHWWPISLAYIDNLALNCSNSIANTLDLLQSTALNHGYVLQKVLMKFRQTTKTISKPSGNL